MSIDDRIYCLQKSNIPKDLSVLLKQADVAFLKDDDTQAHELLTHIELECRRRGMIIYTDRYMQQYEQAEDTDSNGGTQ